MSDIFPQTAVRLNQWKEQPEVLGVLLVGSKSRGHNDAFSDDDLEVLLTDEAFASLDPANCGEFLTKGEGVAKRIIYDTQYTSLTDLEHKLSSPRDLDHWLEAELRTLVDPTGAGTLLLEAIRSSSPEPLAEALKGLEDRLAEDGVPRPEGRLALFYELIHFSHTEERAIHGLF